MNANLQELERQYARALHFSRLWRRLADSLAWACANRVEILARREPHVEPFTARALAERSVEAAVRAVRAHDRAMEATRTALSISSAIHAKASGRPTA